MPAASRASTRLREIGRAFRVDATTLEAEAARLVAAYTAGDRHYHDIGHIDALLLLSEAHRARSTDSVAVDLAILYHDVVYDPARRDNEAASAGWARRSLARLGMPEPLIAKVARYVEATAHLTPPDAVGQTSIRDADLDLLLDLDLSILAAVPDAYDTYAAAIRREHGQYPEPAYVAGRTAVLRRLLALPRLYRSPVLAALWEAPARANLARELERLEHRPPA